jgi:alpha-1,2-mannosyltransferase
MSDGVNRTLPRDSDARTRRSESHRAIVRGRVATCAGVLLCFGWLVHGWQVAVPGLTDRSGRLKGVDYIQFYVMGAQVRSGRADLLYNNQSIAEFARRTIAPTLEYRPERNPYGPQIALLFSPLAALPFLGSLAVFSVISIITYVAAVRLLWRQAPALAGESLCVVLVAAGLPALLITLRFGQISALSLFAGALSLTALAAGRRFLAGASLGLLAYKPQLLIVAVPVLAFARDWRYLGGVFAGAITPLVIVWAALGSYIMRQYVTTLMDLAAKPDLVMLYPENSHSVRGFLRLFGTPPAIATWMVGVLIVAIAPPLARLWRSDASPLFRFGLLVLVTMLFTPHLITYDLLLLTVPMMAMAEWAVVRAGDDSLAPVVVLAVALYLAPFSAWLAERSHLQLSTLAMAAAACVMWRIAVAHRGALVRE